MNEKKAIILKEAAGLAVLLTAMLALWAVPYLINATENAWHWINDEGPSFLVALILYYGSRVLLVLAPIGYVIRLARRRYHG